MRDRIEYIDLAKGICIFLVVFSHVANFYHYYNFPLRYELTAFRIPLYYILSGLFFKPYGGGREFIIRKINKLLIPYLFFFTIGVIVTPYILFYIFDFTMNDWYGPNVIKCLILPFIRESSSNSPIWFLWTLFIINLLFYFSYDITKSYAKNIYILGLLCFAIGLLGVGASILHINIKAHIDSALTGLPFFWFGYYLRHNTLFLEKETSFIKSFAIILSAVCLLWTTNRLLGGNTEYGYWNNTFTNNPYFFIYPCGIIGAISILILSKLIKKIPVISYCGRYSLIILGSHYTILSIVGHLIQFHNTGLSVTINFFLTLTTCIALIPMLTSFVPTMTAQKDLIKIK